MGCAARKLCQANLANAHERILAAPINRQLAKPCWQRVCNIATSASSGRATCRISEFPGRATRSISLAAT
eukprot:2025599-Alexandrium_andersonii.AAC.1